VLIVGLVEWVILLGELVQCMDKFRVVVDETLVKVAKSEK